VRARNAGKFAKVVQKSDSLHVFACDCRLLIPWVDSTPVPRRTAAIKF
jgi:hypothetical protein